MGQTYALYFITLKITFNFSVSKQEIFNGIVIITLKAPEKLTEKFYAIFIQKYLL
jgi:hypothetical protein